MPNGSIRPDMRFAYLPDVAVPNQLAQFPHTVAAVPLVAHLRGDACLARNLGQQTSLGDGIGQGFLHVDMFAYSHRVDRGHGVKMVRGGYIYRVDVFLVEHFAKIDVFLRIGEFGEGPRGAFPLRVAQRDDVLATAAVCVGPSLAAGAYRGDIQLR